MKKKVLDELIASAESVCSSLEHETDSSYVLQQWRLRDALKAATEDRQTRK